MQHTQGLNLPPSSSKQQNSIKAGAMSQTLWVAAVSTGLHCIPDVLTFRIR